MYGATWEGYFVAQADLWFRQGMGWRLFSGLLVIAGYIFLIYDMLTCTKKQPAEAYEAEAAAA